MSTSIGDLALKLGINSAEYLAGLRTAGVELSSFTNKGKADVSGLAATFENLKTVATGTFQALAAQSKTQTQEVKEQSDAWSKIEDTITDVITGYMLAQIPLLGLAATTAKVAESTKDWGGDLDDVTEHLARIYAFSQTIGDTPFNAQITTRAFERGGLEPGDAQTTVQRFFQRVGEARHDLAENASTPTGDALRRLGINAQRLSTTSSSQAIEEVASALGKVEDRYTRAQLAQEIFGRGFIGLEELIRRSGPIFDEAKKDIRAFGQTDDVVRMAERTKRDWEEFAHSWERDVTGPIGAAWQRLYANLDAWNADFFKKLVIPAVHFQSQIVQFGLNTSGPVVLGDLWNRAFPTAAGNNPLATPVETYRGRFFSDDPERGIQNAGESGRLPRFQWETGQENVQRTLEAMRSAGVLSSWLGPMNGQERFDLMRQMNPNIVHQGEMGGQDRDDLAAMAPVFAAMNEAFGMLTGRRDATTLFGMSPEDIQLHNLREKLGTEFDPATGAERQRGGELIAQIEDQIRAFRSLTETTQRFQQGMDLLDAAREGRGGPAGSALRDFKRDLGLANEALPGDENSLARSEAAVFLFQRLERAIGPGTIHDVASSVNFDSAERVRAVENARRSTIQTDPQKRIEDVLRRANEQREESLREQRGLREQIEKNGLAVAQGIR